MKESITNAIEYLQEHADSIKDSGSFPDGRMEPESEEWFKEVTSIIIGLEETLNDLEWNKTRIHNPEIWKICS